MLITTLDSSDSNDEGKNDFFHISLHFICINKYIYIVFDFICLSASIKNQDIWTYGTNKHYKASREITRNPLLCDLMEPKLLNRKYRIRRHVYVCKTL